MNTSASGALVAFMAGPSHSMAFFARRATLPNRTNSVSRALYSKFPLAGLPPLQAASQSA